MLLSTGLWPPCHAGFPRADCPSLGTRVAAGDLHSQSTATARRRCRWAGHEAEPM
jgi:hypothetical protein